MSVTWMRWPLVILYCQKSSVGAVRDEYNDVLLSLPIQWENQKLEKESPQLSNTGGSRRRQYRKEYIENDSRRDMFN